MASLSPKAFAQWATRLIYATQLAQLENRLQTTPGQIGLFALLYIPRGIK